MIEVTEAMTAADVRTACCELAEMIGPQARVTAFFNSARYAAGKNLMVTIYRDDRAPSASHHIYGNTFDEALTEARQWIENNKVVHRNATIRGMALAIIELTDEHGECTAVRLVAKGFGAETIRELHRDACRRASEMCFNAPFEVVMTPVAA